MSTKKEDQTTTTKKPTSKNNVFDHTIDDVFGAMGCSSKTLEKKWEEFEDKIDDHDDGNGRTRTSVALELLIETFTKKELALLWMAERNHRREAERDPIEAFRAAVRKSME